MSEALHEKSHPAALHTGMALAGELHTLPHWPQFEVSLATSTHEPEQAVSAPHSVEQTPDLQTLPAAHTVVQLPQC